MRYGGWYQIAFERDLQQDVSSVPVGDRRLLIVRNEGKINVYIGTLDTFRLEGAMKLVAADLKQLGSDATIVFAEGRDHSSVAAPHPDHWPDGMMARVHKEMRARFDAAVAK